ncbi:MAG: TadE/TadG family type IV pilus assembly protein [Propioniciclava sp.]
MRITDPSNPISRAQRGSVTVEFTVMVPVLLLLIGLVVAGGRMAHAQRTVHQLSDSAARAASLARTPAQAQADADLVIHGDAQGAKLTCTGGGPSSSVDVSGFAQGLGTPAVVTVEVQCQVALSDLLLPVLPGVWSVTASASSPLDQFRSRR